MSSLMLLPLLWAQAAPGAPRQPTVLLQWLYVFGGPTITVDGVWGGPLTWLKVIAIITLLSWIGTWAIAGFRGRMVAAPLHLVSLGGAVLVGLGGIALGTLAGAGRAPSWVV